MTKYKIYKLIDPRDQKVRYVGVTIRKLSERLSQHCSEARNHIGTHKRYWIKSLLEEGLKPIISIIEYCTEQNWQEKEKYWIDYYDNLTNTNQGGAGIVQKSTDSIKKSAEGHYKPIVQLDLKLNLINEYKSIKEAVKSTGIRQTNISEVLSGRTLTAGGYHFVYKYLYTKEYFIDLSKSSGIKFPKPVSIIYRDNNTQNFSNITECSKYLEVSQSMLSMILSGKRKIPKKFKDIKSINYIKI